MPKKTHEEYVAELKEKNPTIIPLEEYVNISKKILHKCMVCGNEWMVQPDQLLREHGCPKCTKNILSQSEFEKKVETYGKVKILGEYRNAKSKIKCLCLICNEIVELPTYSVAHGGGHQKCSNKILSERCRKTTEQFTRELESTLPSVKILGKYTGAKDKIKCECLKCGNIWEPIATNLLRGHGCSICAHENLKYTEVDFNEYMTNNMPDIIVLGDYKGHSEKINVKCSVCGNIWETIPEYLYHNKGCYFCGKRRTGEKLSMSNDEFLKKLYDLSLDVIPIDSYVRTQKKIEVKCKHCGHIWKTKPNSLLQGHGCPNCKKSIGEKFVASYLKKHKIKFILHKSFDNLLGINGGKLSYDFYIMSYNLLIEYQGKQHYHPVEYFGGNEQFKNQQEHDRRKREYAKSNDINLLEIRYDQDVSTILDEYFQTHSPLKKYSKIQPLSRVKNNLKLESVETVIPA